MSELNATPSATVELHIPFYDVDPMQIAWHGHYAKYFERARCALLETIGHDYDAMFASGYAWPIVDLRVRYLRPLRYNQHICVTATLKRWDHQLRIAYRIRDREQGASLARAITVQAPVDTATGALVHNRPEAATAALVRAGLLDAASTGGSPTP